MRPAFNWHVQVYFPICVLQFEYYNYCVIEIHFYSPFCTSELYDYHNGLFEPGVLSIVT